MSTTLGVEPEGSRTPVSSRRHRLHWFTGRTHEVLDELGRPSTWALTAAERGEVIAELVALRDRVEMQLMGVVAEADRADDAATTGATHTAGWVAGLTRLVGREASRLVKAARRLEAHDRVAEALREGWLRTEQAQVIVAAVDALPDEVADQRESAEEHLLGLATEYDAAGLRVLGRHLLEVVAPDVAEDHLARTLGRDEAHARRTAYIQTWDDGDGSTHGRFKIPSLHGVILQTLVQALANPARPDPIPRAGVASPQVDGQAFCELLERYPVDRLPDTGGVSATIVVTVPLETLEGRLAAAGILGTDHRLSPGEARRLACAAGVIPAVLGSRSQVLDLGRRRRLHTRPQRLALALTQDGLCNITDCDRPTTWADAHHPHPWSHGGTTTLANGELICPRHHTLVHQGHHYPRRT